MALFFNNRRDMGNISMSPSMYPGDIVQDERFGVDPMTQEAVDQYAALPAPIMEGRKGGGFGEVLKALAGGVLDGVATHYGAEPGYSGARTQRDKLMAEMQARQAEEAQRLRLYEAQKQIDQKYREPPELEGFDAELARAGIDPQSPQGLEMKRRKVTFAADPWVEFKTPDGQFIAGPRSQVESKFGGAGGQSAVIGTQLPQGWKIEGDGGSNAPGGFPY